MNYIVNGLGDDQTWHFKPIFISAFPSGPSATTNARQ